MALDENLTRKQLNAVAQICSPQSDGGALLAFDMGIGKTRTGVLVAKEMNAQCVLAVVPLETIADSWVPTIEREYPDLPVRVIDSSAKGRKNLAGFQWREPGFYLVTHQYWERKAWVKELVKKKRKTEPDKFRKVDSGVWGGPGFLFIFDESHASANSLSWTFRALMNLDHRVFKLAMSGTFFGDRFDGAYGATKWIWPHRTDILPNDIFAWRAIWANVAYDPFAPRNQKVVGEKVEGAFVSALPCYIREESDQPEALVYDIWLHLYPEQRRVYDELDKRMVAWIEGNPLVAEYSITKRVRQRQTTLAMPTLVFDPDTDELLDVYYEDDAESAKTDALISEINGEGLLGNLLVDEQLLIFTDSQQFAALLTKRLNKEYGDVAREWSGKITKPRRKILKAQFIEGTVRFIVGVQAAMGTGTDGLQYSDAHIVVNMSRADRRINNEQGIARLNRKGQRQQVHVVNFLAYNTVDTGQISKQLEAAIAAAKSMRKKAREDARRNANNLSST